ncbi:MAG TPA: VWA domain-containing protein, partial [Vicinamibacteria bacterium]|nr:VWA domain-containing protein [Vicinamibacteria bacterium]
MFRADLAMVQVDVVVTDQKGQFVTDLDCEDFEIAEDDRSQPVAQCAFVPLQGPALESLPTARSAVPPTTVGPPARIDRSAVQRVMVLVVDDLNLDRQSVESIRTGLKSFVANEMQAGDLVSVVRTGSGGGALQQFTSDKRVLMAAIDRVRFNIQAQVDAFEPVQAVPVLGRNPQGMTKIEQLRTEQLSGGTIATFRLVLRGLQDLPGRKSVVFLSKGWALRDKDGLTGFGRAIPDLVELANRASAVLYAVDVLGVFTGQLTAGDDMNDPNINNRLTAPPTSPDGSLMNLSVRPRTAPRPGLDGLSALSDPTGGLLLQGGNDLSQQLKRIVDDQRGYYLVGYAPRPSAFEPAKGSPTFHKITVKVRRKGLTVRSRRGFYGVSDTATGTASGHAPTLGGAVLSPFQANGIRLKLSSVFAHDKTKGDSVQALLRVDASDVTFEQGGDGL